MVGWSASNIFRTYWDWGRHFPRHYAVTQWCVNGSERERRGREGEDDITIIHIHTHTWLGLGVIIFEAACSDCYAIGMLNYIGQRESRQI